MIQRDSFKENRDVPYDNSALDYASCVTTDEGKKKLVAWNSKTLTIDQWRHRRMFDLVYPLVSKFPDDSWLTVGDGRYGLDGHHIKKFGAKDVLCTDLNTVLLEEAKAAGVIDHFSQQNAEDLDFADNQFDFVFCKESLHHFPRPFKALHEMHRVARKAVIIIEPRDFIIDTTSFSAVFQCAWRALRKQADFHGFEPVGNYIFRISERELEKFQLGMHCRRLAVKGLNDAYLAGIEDIGWDDPTFAGRAKRWHVQMKIRTQDLLNLLRFRKTGLLVAIIPTSNEYSELIDFLHSESWDIRTLPANPYRVL